MRVVFVVNGAVSDVRDGRLATVRYRGLIPAAELARLDPGMRPEVVPFTDLMRPDFDSRIDLLVLHQPKKDTIKLVQQFPVLLGHLQAVRRHGGVVVIDVSDLKFSLEHHRAMVEEYGEPAANDYRKFLEGLFVNANGIVVPTVKLGELMQQAINLPLPIHVVGDPIEVQHQPARFAPGETLKLLWYGTLRAHGPVMQKFFATDLPAIAAATPVDVHMVCEAVPDDVQAAVLGPFHRAANVRFTEWSVAALERALTECDIVVLPFALDSMSAVGKSNNRALQALYAGRFVAAHPIESYLEVGSFCGLDVSLPRIILAARANPAAALDMLQRGQSYVAERYTPAAIGGQWLAMIRNVLGIAAPTPAPVQAPTPVPVAKAAPLRLNLGCGDKILPGYINCDALASRGQGGAVDVQCNITKPLPFADNIADEVLAVHVVEHIWRWEVIDVLRDWRRVLQPGGQIILECPNLLSAALELIKNPTMAAGPGPEGQRSMWVFYGDPRWRDPLMNHCWGYTPQSLAALLAEAGFVDVRQEPAQFKLREPRDMRIVGVKPA